MSFFAVDIEHSGHDIIAIGAVVVDDKGEKVHEFFATCYNPQTRFTKKCWSQFWSKNPEALQGLVDCPQKVSNASELTELFYNFYTDVWHQQMTFISDKPGFDIGELNAELYCLGKSSLYTDQHGKYHKIKDVVGVQEGIIRQRNNGVSPEWGLSQFIREQYATGTKLPLIEHDHNPVNDAHSMIIDFLICLEITHVGERTIVDDIDDLFSQEYYKPYKSYFEYIKHFPWDDELFRQGSYTIHPTEKDLSYSIIDEIVIVKVNGVPIESLTSYKKWLTQVNKLFN